MGCRLRAEEVCVGRRGGKGPPAPRPSIVPLADSAASFYFEFVGLRPPPYVGGKFDRIFELWRLYY